MPSINAAVLKQFANSECQVVSIDLSTAQPDLSLISRAGRFPKALRGLLTLVTTRLSRRPAVMYLSPSARYGQLYDLAYVVLARLRRIRLVLHHHSFSYIDQPTFLSRRLLLTAGHDCTHICLCTCMASLLSQAYTVANVLSISNSVFLIRHDAATFMPRGQVRRIGFISTISVEKGVEAFLDVVATAALELPALKATLAGPFQDNATEQAIRARLPNLHNLQFLGPVHAVRKEEFFASIDVLILPTRYKNEAEPLVVLEAFAEGIPVISTSRGCIGDLLAHGGGLVVHDYNDFVSATMYQLHQWIKSPSDFEHASMAAYQTFVDRLKADDSTWQDLFHSIADT